MSSRACSSIPNRAIKLSSTPVSCIFVPSRQSVEGQLTGAMNLLRVLETSLDEYLSAGPSSCVRAQCITFYRWHNATVLGVCAPSSPRCWSLHSRLRAQKRSLSCTISNRIPVIIPFASLHNAMDSPVHKRSEDFMQYLVY